MLVGASGYGPILTGSMPTYEYRCTKGHSFEVVQGIHEAPLTKCQVCGQPVQRVMHSPAVHFKGSGFYNTDYGTKKRQREQKSSSDSGSSESGATSSSDAAPAKSDGKGGSDAKPDASDKPKPKPASE
jgi:putative FmdB family regulatory protein